MGFSILISCTFLDRHKGKKKFLKGVRKHTFWMQPLVTEWVTGHTNQFWKPWHFCSNKNHILSNCLTMKNPIKIYIKQNILEEQKLHGGVCWHLELWMPQATMSKTPRLSRRFNCSYIFKHFYIFINHVACISWYSVKTVKNFFCLLITLGLCFAKAAFRTL